MLHYQVNTNIQIEKFLFGEKIEQALLVEWNKEKENLKIHNLYKKYGEQAAFRYIEETIFDKWDTEKETMLIRELYLRHGQHTAFKYYEQKIRTTENIPFQYGRLEKYFSLTIKALHKNNTDPGIHIEATINFDDEYFSKNYKNKYNISFIIERNEQIEIRAEDLTTAIQKGESLLRKILKDNSNGECIVQSEEVNNDLYEDLDEILKNANAPFQKYVRPTDHNMRKTPF